MVFVMQNMLVRFKCHFFNKMLCSIKIIIKFIILKNRN